MASHKSVKQISVHNIISFLISMRMNEIFCPLSNFSICTLPEKIYFHDFYFKSSIFEEFKYPDGEIFSTQCLS